MIQLYENMKASPKRPPVIEELRLAANLPPLNAHEAAILITNLKAASLGLVVSDDLALGPDAVVSFCSGIFDGYLLVL